MTVVSVSATGKTIKLNGWWRRQATDADIGSVVFTTRRECVEAMRATKIAHAENANRDLADFEAKHPIDEEDCDE
jgi:hypothetical protein